MNQIKSSLRDLREIIESSFTVRQIAEPLASFDLSTSGKNIQTFLDNETYDIVGVRENGRIIGYWHRSYLENSMKNKQPSNFDQSIVIPDSTPLRYALLDLVNSPRLFILVLDRVSGIVTRSDLQKMPVRMWLFALISLVEMQLLRLIREFYPSNSWKVHLTQARLDAADKIHQLRLEHNEDIDIADCLQLCDKQNIIIKTDQLRKKIGLQSKTRTRKLLQKLEKLRNKLAHAQELEPGKWAELMDLAKFAEDLIERCEKLTPQHTPTN